ncbi:MAG: DUF2520 domain-containing protein [Alcaligenaceae bacterium]|nr:DUF2520 domain-containing protein [Alcaligenaceae bacterium]
MTRIDHLNIGFIGAGRLGKTLARLCSNRGLRVGAIASRNADHARELAALINDCSSLSAQQVADACDLIFITTPDQAIQTTADAITWRPGSLVVHCSGATEVEVLHKAATDGAFIGGFHPLQTFADPDAAMQSLPGCTITIEAQEARLNETLVTIAEHLNCRVNRLPPGARARYHAAAGYASQFINVLLREAAVIWSSWGGTERDAIHALMPLVRGTLASIEQLGPVAGMPGPVSRGDAGSVAKHVKALAENQPDLLPLYSLLCQETVSMALESGRINPEHAAQLRALLSQSAAPGHRNPT